MAQKERERLGQDKLKIDPSKSVFINCPFDQDFKPRFYATIFATVCCGFWPRSALESGSVAEPRMERITRAIFSSKYSIHDLSRCKGEGDEHLARFNMPLELGIAMGRRYARTRKAEKHDWLGLVPEDHDYDRFVSDLAGFDLCRYDGTVKTLIREVMRWLVTRPDAVRARTARDVVEAFPRFTVEIDKLERQWLGAVPPWADIVLAALTICRSLSNRATSAF